MPKLGPVSLRVFIARMRKLGWSGPYQEGKHPYMVKGGNTLTVPNPHESEISQDLLVRLLRQAGITRAEYVIPKSKVDARYAYEDAKDVDSAVSDFWVKIDMSNKVELLDDALSIYDAWARSVKQ